MSDAEVVQQLRENKDIDYFKDLVDEIEGADEEIDIPERSELFTDEVVLSSEPDDKININGAWVHPIFARWVNQINSGQTPMIAVVGKEGLGKSITALYIMKTLHEDINVLKGSFNIQNQVVYRPLNYLFLERESVRTGIMFEEANETLNVNDYHEDFNAAVAAASRTQRKRENPKIFVCPELQMLDSRIRDKIGTVIELKSKRVAEITTYQLKHAKKNNRGLDYYFNTDYPDWGVPEVPENVIAEYDELDNQYKGSYLDELLLNLLRERMQELEEDATAEI